MRDELYIDGTKVDMGESGVSLEYRSNILTDISKIVSNFSYTIKLPKTKNNLRLIECAHIPSAVSSFPYLPHVGTLLRDGVQIVDGANVVLMSVSDTIEIALSWGNIQGFENILNSDKTLRDLTELPLSGAWSYWWKLRTPDMEHPMVNYGFNDAEEGVWYHPVIPVSELMRQIATDNGISFEYDRESVLAEIRIPLLTKNGSPEQSEECSLILVPNGMGNSSDSGKEILFERISVSNYFFSALLGTGAGGSFTAGVINNFINTKYSVSWNLTCSISGTIPEELYLVMSIGGTEIMSASPYSINGSKVAFNLNGTTDIVGKYGNVDGRIKFFIKGLQDVNVVSELSGDMTLAPDSEVTAYDGDGYNNRYYHIPNLPDIKQMDFLKAITAMLGLFAVPKSDGTGIRFFSFDTILENKSKAVDWSMKIVCAYYGDLPRTISYSLNGFSKNNWFRYKEDDTVKGNYDGKIVVESESLDDERDVITLPFAACDYSGNMVSIPLYSYNSEGKLEMNDIEPRLIYRSGNDGTIASFKELEWGTLLSKYYSSYQDIVKHPKVISEYVRLSPVELKELDLTVPVYLRQYGSYFAIVKVKTKENNICEVELLKI